MLLDTRYEFLKLASQKKNYIAVAGHMVLLVLCIIGMGMPEDYYRHSGMAKSGMQLDIFKTYLDGIFFARALLLPTFVIILPILICTVGGDMIAGEIQDGSMRLYVSRPRTRTSMILSKIVAMFMFSLLYCVYFGIVGLAAGIAFYGYSETQLIPLLHLGFGTDLEIMNAMQSLLRYGMIVVYYSFSIMTLGIITLFFSTLFNRMT
ncbi:MAG TPA: ABC transporter permease, partial [Victivallales bacterium]|nr:ABC transporter permease [Victivallales bacterium]